MAPGDPLAPAKVVARVPGGLQCGGKPVPAAPRPGELRITKECKGREAALEQVFSGERALGPVVALDVRPARPGPWSFKSTVGIPVARSRRVSRGASREMIPSPSQVRNHGGARSISERCSIYTVQGPFSRTYWATPHKISRPKTIEVSTMQATCGGSNRDFFR